jgi:hypothetical protein
MGDGGTLWEQIAAVQEALRRAEWGAEDQGRPSCPICHCLHTTHLAAAWAGHAGNCPYAQLGIFHRYGVPLPQNQEDGNREALEMLAVRPPQHGALSGLRHLPKLREVAPTHPRRPRLDQAEGPTVKAQICPSCPPVGRLLRRLQWNAAHQIEMPLGEILDRPIEGSVLRAWLRTFLVSGPPQGEEKA